MEASLTTPVKSIRFVSYLNSAGGDHVRREAEADFGGAHRSPGEADGGLSSAMERPRSWSKQVPSPDVGFHWKSGKGGVSLPQSWQALTYFKPRSNFHEWQAPLPVLGASEIGHGRDAV